MYLEILISLVEERELTDHREYKFYFYTGSTSAFARIEIHSALLTFHSIRGRISA